MKIKQWLKFLKVLGKYEHFLLSATVNCSWIIASAVEASVLRTVPDWKINSDCALAWFAWMEKENSKDSTDITKTSIIPRSDSQGKAIYHKFAQHIPKMLKIVDQKWCVFKKILSFSVIL